MGSGEWGVGSGRVGGRGGAGHPADEHGIHNTIIEETPFGRPPKVSSTCICRIVPPPKKKKKTACSMWVRLLLEGTGWGNQPKKQKPSWKAQLLKRQPKESRRGPIATSHRLAPRLDAPAPAFPAPALASRQIRADQSGQRRTQGLSMATPALKA